MKSYLYYPGCSLSGSARAYSQSLSAILEPLGIELREIDDWNCCGATEYLTLSPLRGQALISRNLALAEAQRDGTDTLVAPCSACYVNLAKTDRYFRESPQFRARLNEVLAADGLHYTPGAVRVRHLLEVLLDDVGLDAISAAVVKPLKGLRVAPYLGCLVSRPDLDRRWELHEQPRELDRLMAALGAEVVDFSARTACCGGHMTQISPDVAWELLRRIVEPADQAQADLLVTVCPMCQMNVDSYQGEMDRHLGLRYHMPILFFTQLIGLAFGRPAAELGIGTEVVSAARALARIGVEIPPPAEEPAAQGSAGGHEPRRQKRPTGLPMPEPLPERPRQAELAR
jgi:heterodisulfide reductase subunit B